MALTRCYGIHWRDENTNAPLLFSAFPNFSTNASSINDHPPAASGTAPGGWDIPHHPSIGYAAYLATGRFYFLEELQLIATYNFLNETDINREFSKGIIKSNTDAYTVRGAGWAMRTLAQAATATPDADTALRTQLFNSIKENIDFYHARYVAQANNPFGFVQPYSDYTASPHAGPTVAGSTATLICLDSGTSSAVTGYYVGWGITISGEERTVIAYNGSTHVATVDSAFSAAPPTGTSWQLKDRKYFDATWQHDFHTAAYGYG